MYVCSGIPYAAYGSDDLLLYDRLIYCDKNDVFFLPKKGYRYKIDSENEKCNIGKVDEITHGSY